MATAYSPISKDQATIYQPSYSRLAYSFGHAPGNTANILPTWTPLGKSSGREPSDLDDDDTTNTSEIDELAFDEDAQTPIKKQKVSSYESILSHIQSTKVSPGHTKSVNPKVTPSQSRPTELQPLADVTISTLDLSGARGLPSPLDDSETLPLSGAAIESNIFAGNALDSTTGLDTSSTPQGERPSLEAQIFTSDVEVFGGLLRARNVRNPFSRRTIFSTHVSAPTSNPTSESISSSSYDFASSYPKKRRRQAQPQWESPKATKRRVLAVPSREIDADELEVLTKANVSPVVFLRPRYAALPCDEQREAVMRWNLRWVSRMVEGQREENRKSKGTLMGEDTSNSPALGSGRGAPVAVLEMTRSQRRNLTIDGILVKGKKVRFASPEQSE